MFNTSMLRRYGVATLQTTSWKVFVSMVIINAFKIKSIKYIFQGQVFFIYIWRHEYLIIDIWRDYKLVFRFSLSLFAKLVIYMMQILINFVGFCDHLRPYKFSIKHIPTDHWFIYGKSRATFRLIQETTDLPKKTCVHYLSRIFHLI